MFRLAPGNLVQTDRRLFGEDGEDFYESTSLPIGSVVLLLSVQKYYCTVLFEGRPIKLIGTNLAWFKRFY